ncbi:hypothetical protein RSSM_06236 [Rhodopirellula sallentina SM41]|uniref:Uncharacterized protein n=1 Tax=Rhodopirellula sallentina SM41 TaxID=1263870 RepID=M5TT44_9BACT|nr:hypothetical protein RSSM_06236 [Rhodopirellula sallentina SM41]
MATTLSHSRVAWLSTPSFAARFVRWATCVFSPLRGQIQPKIRVKAVAKVANGLSIYSFNGQPKATYLPLHVAYGYRLNENRLTLE